MRKRNERNDSCIIINYTENSTEIMTSRGIEYRTIIFFSLMNTFHVFRYFFFLRRFNLEKLSFRHFSVFSNTLHLPLFKSYSNNFRSVFTLFSSSYLIPTKCCVSKITHSRRYHLFPFFLLARRMRSPPPFLSLFVK